MILANLHPADWFQLGAAVFTAGAASAAWATVAQASRDRRAAQRPLLHIEVVTRVPSGDTFVNIFNEGGPAKLVRFIVIEGDRVCLGNVPPTSYLRRGEWRRLRLDLTSQADAAIAMVAGADLSTRFLYARIPNGTERRYRVYRRVPWGPQPELNMDSMLRGFFPNAPDVRTLKTVGYELVAPESSLGVGPMPTSDG